MLYPVPYVAVIDVGHGNSTVLRDESCTIVIDCGTRGSSLLEFLSQEGIFSIDAVVLSHADQDHIGGLVTVLASKQFNITKVFVNSDSSKGSRMWDNLTYELSILSETGGPQLNIGISRSLGKFHCGSISLETIGPTAYLAAKGTGGKDRGGREISSNSISASFHVLWRDEIIAYLAGDIDQIALDDLVDHSINLRAPLLVFPHHGGKSDKSTGIAFTEQLCELIAPSTVVFSIGRNVHLNPRPEIVATLKSKIANVRIACTQLSKHCAISLPRFSSPHLLPVFSRGKSMKECCGGTFVIKLGDAVQHLPDYKSHLGFIEKSAPTPLCIKPE